MKRLIAIGFSLALLVVLSPALAGAAESVTVEGTLLCAKCSLGHDLEKCQNALVAKGEDGEETVYYLAKNDVAEKAGHPCQESWKVKATGKVADRDGQAWFTASKIERVEG